jgi:hypothetical protein
VAPPKKPTERQHYVPKLHLRNFARDGKVYVFDKSSQTRFHTSLENIGLERNFYTLPVDAPGDEPLVEEVLERFESVLAPVFRSILGRVEYRASISDRRVHITPRERAILGLHLVLQTVRTPSYRSNLGHVRSSLREFVAAVSGDISATSEREPVSDDKTIQILHLLSDRVVEHASIIAGWSFTFHYNRSEIPLYTSDVPVLVHDMTTFEPASLPFDVPGFGKKGKTLSRFSPKTAFEIAMSPRVALVVAGEGEYGLLPGLDGRVIDAENVRPSNAMHVTRCVRHVITAEDSFDFAREVLMRDPAAAAPGKRVAVSPGEYARQVRQRTRKPPR